MSRSERTNVFTEATEGTTAPSGYSEVVIKASIKTPLEGYYVLESRESPEGKPEYPFLFNLDGQAALWKAVGQKETIPLYDESGRESRDPEAGEGMKYHLEKKIRVAAGKHRVALGLPGASYLVEVELTLQAGGPDLLEFKPRYRYKTHPTRIPTFFKGVDGYEIFLNGDPIT